MKKVIIVNNNLGTGGVQRSLINLLKEIAPLYDVTLLLFYADENYINDVPVGVNVTVLNSPFKYLGMSSAQAKKSSPLKFLLRSFWAVLTKLCGRGFAIRLMSIFQEKLVGYDYAVSYLHEGGQNSFYGGCNEFVLRKINATKKITWLHCDYSLCGANNLYSEKIYKQFDTIVACSYGVKKVFSKCLPQLEDRCVVVRNCNDYDLIKEAAMPKFEYDGGCFNIVTVARLSKEKGIERMLRAVALVKDYAVKYHIVGDGDQKQSLLSLAKELDIVDNVVFYGNKDNPYPYIAGADLFALPSYHEAAPMVFDEAVALKTPIFATKTTSTYEMIEENYYGFVCENKDEAIADMLLWILDNPRELDKVKQSLANCELSNKESINKVKMILE